MNPQVVIPLVMMVCILIIGIVIFVVMSQQKTDDQDADEEEEEEEEEEEGTIGEGEMDTMGDGGAEEEEEGGDRSLFKPAGTIEQNEDGSIAEHKGGGLSTTTWKPKKKLSVRTR
jgi:flagellar biosynthesis/type III secretory pathway M-ring protein FliF/YscJ